MNTTTLRLSLLAALLGSALSAHAGMLTYTLYPTIYPFSYGTTTVPAFDASLGTLTAVQIASNAGGETTGNAGSSSVAVASSGASGTYFYHLYSPKWNPAQSVTAFRDLSTVDLPLNWGAQGMAVTWSHNLWTVWGTYQIQLTYTPVPEPSAFAALGVGALALLRRRARR